jgi:Fe-S-cluster-containing dehydrogenase component
VVRAQPELCYACLGCIVACAYANLGFSDDAPLRPEVLSAARLSVEAAGGYSVPLHCMQCADAPCLLVCPTGALQRVDPNSPIFAVVARCIGCKSCVLACPFGVLTLDARQHVVQKCDQCLGRTRQGRQPACVEHCPTGALMLVNLEELTAKKAEAFAVWSVSSLQTCHTAEWDSALHLPLTP